MNVELTGEMIEALGDKDLRPFGVDPEKLRWNQAATVNMRRCTAEQVASLQKMLSKVDVKGSRKAMRDLKTWIEAGQKGAENVRCKDTKHFAALAREYIKRQPGYRLYGKDEGHNTWRAYYVGGIQYNPKKVGSGGVTPAYTLVQLYYSELGVNNLVRITVNDRECKNLTVPEVLSNEGYITETPELRDDYETNIAKYVAIHDKLGMQFWASGIGTTNLDGNRDDDENRGWRYWKMETVPMVHQGERSRVVLDIAHETDTRPDKENDPDPNFWSKEAPLSEDEEDDSEEGSMETEEEAAAETSLLDVPVYPIVPVFDLKRHMRLRVHVANLEEYAYDERLGEKLVLPSEVRQLVEILLQRRGVFRDIISGKSGGVTILCAGVPGVGKTLTAEVFAEVDKRPLYSVQCSQLGTDPDELEAAILKAFARAQRWNAILLLDEADVYVRARGVDIQQNAIVGVFLRVLEYYSGVLFLTTNRSDEVDDAILSRCLARIDYTIPTVEEQAKIWNILADGAGIKLAAGLAKTISEKYPNLSGRDVKQLLKLGGMVTMARGYGEVTVDVIESVKRFKASAS
jgi:SpoVK/Ycf46/Vps4 family AAA+-type ATPase